MRMVRLVLATGLVLAAAGCAAPYAPPPAYGPRYAMPDRYGPPRSAEDERGWRMTRRRGETDYELSERVLFGLDSARISPGAASILDEIASAARARPGALVVVEGHTDTSGTWEHNQELSEARARAVAVALQWHGVERDRLRVEGLGKQGLAVQTADGVREPRNRRVVIRLMDAPEPLPGRYDGRYGSY